MSLKYRDKNGAEVVLAGLTPGGDLEYGAVATRKGTWSLPQTAAGNAYATIVFTEPMPDADYEINLEVTSVHWTPAADNHTPFMIQDKTANGFTIKFYTFNGFQSVDGNYTAYKLYEVADAEQLYSKVQDLESMVPSNASSTNKFTTADDLKTETKVLDRRLDDVEDAIPTSASITNKLVTQNDLSNVQIDKVEDINDVELTNIEDGQTLIWDNTNSKWVNGQGGKIYSAGNGVNINSTDAISAKINTDQLTFDSSGNINVSNDYKKTFIGTMAQWNALSIADKKKYSLANITDDIANSVVIDNVIDGDIHPVTSNAVYNHIKPILTHGYGEDVTISPNLVSALEAGFQSAASYKLFYVSDQSSEEGGFIGFKHTGAKPCYAIGMSSAWGIISCLRNPTSGNWTFSRISVN